jgi:aerobic carbon-monoxide dehydrogenase medium subunit
MIPAKFEYHAPTTLRQAVTTLRKYDGEARVLAGGMSLVPMMKLRLANLAAVVDLGRIQGLAGVEHAADGSLVIGPMTTHYQIESSDVVQRVAPILAEAASRVGDVQVRNRGTIGGSVAHADPAADLAAAILVLEAMFSIVGGPRRRTVRADKMFVDAYTSALDEGEIIAEVRIPATAPRTGWSYQKLANNARFAVVGIAALLSTDEKGICTRARVAVTGAGPAPARARATERFIIGKELTPTTIAKAATRATNGIEFLGDVHASPEYREHLTEEITKRALTEACQRIT